MHDPRHYRHVLTNPPPSPSVRTSFKYAPTPNLELTNNLALHSALLLPLELVPENCNISTQKCKSFTLSRRQKEWAGILYIANWRSGNPYAGRWIRQFLGAGYTRIVAPSFAAWACLEQALWTLLNKPRQQQMAPQCVYTWPLRSGMLWQVQYICICLAHRLD